MLTDSDPARASRVMQAMPQMKKIDNAGPRQADDGARGSGCDDGFPSARAGRVLSELNRWAEHSMDQD
jgi:hypothetical protein